MNWPICNGSGGRCGHRRPMQAFDRQNKDRWVFNTGKAVCWCHPEVKLPPGYEHFPCTESPPPPTPEEIAEVYKSLGVVDGPVPDR